MLVHYYENRLIVVGKLWCGSKGSYVYDIAEKDVQFLYDNFEDKKLIQDWCKAKAGDFETVTDYQLEVFEKTKQFDDEDSWLIN